MLSVLELCALQHLDASSAAYDPHLAGAWAALTSRAQNVALEVADASGTGISLQALHEANEQVSLCMTCCC